MKFIYFLLFFLISSIASSDTLPPGTVAIKGGTDGTKIGNVADALKVNVTNATSSTVNQGTGGLSPWLITGSVGRTWTLLNSTDSVNVGNFPSTFGVTQATTPWVTSRNWNLGFAGDKVDASGSSVSVSNFPGTQNVNVTNASLPVSQFGAWSTGRTWSLLNTTDSVNVGNFPATQNVAVTNTPTVNIGTTGGLALDTTLSSTAGSATGGTAAAKSELAGAIYNSTPPTLTNGQQAALQFDVNGNLKTTPAGGSTSVTQGTTPWIVGQSSGANLHTNVDNFPASQTVNGTVTAIQPTAANLNATVVQSAGANLHVNVDSAPTTAVTQSGTWTVQQGTPPWAVSQSGAWTTGRTWTLSSGTDSVNVGNFPATFGVTQSTSPWVTSDLADGSVTGGTAGTKSILSGLQFNTVLPTLTNGQQAAAQSDSSGRLLIGALPAGGNTIGAVNQAGAPWSVSGSGNFTVVQPTGTNLHTVVDSGTVTANIGTTNGLALDTTVANVQGSSTGGTAAAKSSLSGGVYNTAAPTLTNGQQASLQFDVNGNLKTTTTGGTTAVTQGTTPWVVGQSSGANLHADIDNFPASQTVNGTITSNQGTSPWVDNVTQFGGSNVVTGTGASGAGIPRVTVANDSNILATQSGTWNINNISGTVSLPTLAATSTKQSDGTQKTQIVDGSGVVVATNYGSAANAIRTAAQIGNASAVADFNAGATTAQTLRVAANSYDGAGNAITSTTVNSKTGQSSIVSGQDPLTVTGTGSALNGDAIAATDVSNYRDIALQLVVTGTNTTTFQGSNDNFTNTFSVDCVSTAANNVSPVTTTAATILVHCPISYKFFRARITAFTSGTSAGTALVSPLPPAADLGQRLVAITGTVPVSGTVSTNPAVQNFSTQVASAARVATGNSGNVTQAAPNNQAVFNLQVTAVSGTAPTLDLVFQESYDGGTTWTDEWHWERVTATGQFSTPNIVMNTNHFRFVWTIAGTTPSFTFSVTSNQGNQVGMIQRRFFDRTIVLTTINSTTASFLTDGCLDYNFTVNQSTCVTFPTLAIQSSEDNVNWATTLTVLATTANGTFASATGQQQSHFSRVIVTTAGTGCTLGYVALRCHQN